MATGRRVHTDKEILEAVQQQCELQGQPVVPTGDVSDAEIIEVKHQTVHDHLKKLHKEGKVGKIEFGKKWKLWWVPNDEKVEVDFSDINWEVINGEDIPREKIEEHPDYHTPTYWESVQNSANTVLNAAIWGFFIGLLIYLTREANIPFVGADSERIIEFIGAFSLVGGVLFGVLALVVIGIAWGGQKLAARGFDEKYNQLKTRSSAWVWSLIPLTVSLDWGGDDEQ
jgi:hypothetical protein